jgi:hypothetical protein
LLGLVREGKSIAVKVLINLGEGIRLFDHTDGEPIALERTEVVTTSQITSLRFRVTKEKS